MTSNARRPRLIAREELATAIGNGARLVDTLDDQLRELVLSREPRCASVETAVEALLAGSDAESFGTWVHYPWANVVVHVLPEDLFHELRTSRNRLKIRASEQARLRGARIGIVGLSAGHAVALTLVLEGVGGMLRLADFDRLGVSNLNRLPGGLPQLGELKTAVAARRVSEIDPYVSVECLDTAISEHTLETLFEGGLDLIIEECDSLDAKIGVRRRARELRVPVLMATSEGGLLDVERFDLEPTRPLLHGLLEGLNPHGLGPEERLGLVERIVSARPLSARTKESLRKVGTELASWPQLGSDVVLGGALVTVAARQILLGQGPASGRFVHSAERVG